jgi:hypothetical protein
MIDEINPIWLRQSGEGGGRGEGRKALFVFNLVFVFNEGQLWLLKRTLDKPQHRLKPF